MGKEYDPNYVPEKVYFQVGQKALIIDNEGKILFLKRSDKTGNKWSFPGGGLEKGKEAIESIKREIKEETDLDGADFQVFYIIAGGSKTGDAGIIIGYKCTSTGKIELNWEHSEYKWLSPKDGLNLELSSHAKILLEQFLMTN